MRPYETMVILSGELGEQSSSLMERFVSIVRDEGGQIDAEHDWGPRKLAYPIKKQTQGHYYLLDYQAEPDIVKELERNLRITEGVLRFMSVQQEHTGLPEKKSDDRYEGGRSDVPMHELRSAPRRYPEDRREDRPEADRAAPTEAPPAKTAADGEPGTAPTTEAAGEGESATVPATEAAGEGASAATESPDESPGVESAESAEKEAAAEAPSSDDSEQGEKENE